MCYCEDPREKARLHHHPSTGVLKSALQSLTFDCLLSGPNSAAVAQVAPFKDSTSGVRQVSLFQEALHVVWELELICTVRGEGNHGLRTSQGEGENIKVVIIVDSALADVVSEHVAESYFPHFATILYLLLVQVLREQKFTQSENTSHTQLSTHRLDRISPGEAPRILRNTRWNCESD